MKDTWNMTPDEAREYILQNWFDGDENVNSFVCGDKEYTAMAIAVEALEATRWHYPSKGEYPTDEGQYWVMRYDDVSKTLFPDILWFEKNTWWNRLHTGDYAVRAWQYIIPPKEEA